MTLFRLVDYYCDIVATKTGDGANDGLERRIIHREPARHYWDFPLPDGVPFFCIPECLSVRDSGAYEFNTTFFAFTLTGGDGSRAYGFALHFYETICGILPSHPRVFCLISHYQFFSLFKEVLTWIHQEHLHTREISQSVGVGNDVACFEGRINRAVHNLVHNTICPPSGSSLHLRMGDGNLFRYHIQHSNVVHVDDLCFQTLFQFLSPKNVVNVLNCMLLEQRILIHSNNCGLLTPVCEALTALMFPFTWEHVYITFLPVTLIEYLQAPVPYLIGLHTSSLVNRVAPEIFSTCVIVHLDKDKVVVPVGSQRTDQQDCVLPRLPAPEVDTLLQTIGRLVARPDEQDCSMDKPLLRKTGDYLKMSMLSPTLSSRPSPDEVELTFNDGPLGITFEASQRYHREVVDLEHSITPSAVVKALPRLHNGLSGPVESSGVVDVGSFLVGINGVSTLGHNFEDIIEQLRHEKRPVRLRFLNTPHIRKSTCQLPVLRDITENCNTLLPWVDCVRGAFAFLFTTLLRDFQQYVCVNQHELPRTIAERKKTKFRSAQSPSARGRQCNQVPEIISSVTFDHIAFCADHPTHAFLRAFTQTQTFTGLVHDSAISREHSNTMAYAQSDLFVQCIHLYHELGEGVAAPALALLFERDPKIIKTHEVDLLQETSFLQQGVATEKEDKKTLGTPTQKNILLDADNTITLLKKRASKTRHLEMIICGAHPEKELTILSPLDELTLKKIGGILVTGDESIAQDYPHNLNGTDRFDKLPSPISLGPLISSVEPKVETLSTANTPESDLLCGSEVNDDVETLSLDEQQHLEA